MQNARSSVLLGLEVHGFGFNTDEETYVRRAMRFESALMEASNTARFRLWPIPGSGDPVIAITHVCESSLLEAQERLEQLNAMRDVNGSLPFPVRILPVPWDRKEEALKALVEEGLPEKIIHLAA